MTDQRAAPSPLEHTLGRLVEAGIGDARELAGLLGLEPRHIGRPLRRLVLARVLESRAPGGLQLTPYGYEWLGIEVAQPDAPPRIVSPGLLLQPLRPDVEEDAGSELDTRAERAAQAKPARLPVVEAPVNLRNGRRPRVGLGWAIPNVWGTSSSLRQPEAMRKLRVAAHGVPLPRLRVTLAGAPLSAAAGRRIGAGVAAVLVLMLGAQAGLRVAGIGGVLTPGASPAQAAPHAVAATTPAATGAPAAAAPVPTAQRVAATPPEQWVVVTHTNGLGLVLRPSPASSERVLTLQEGARVRVTGDPVQQGGRAWLPVASPTGKTGWVADDFVAAEP